METIILIVFFLSFAIIAWRDFELAVLGAILLLPAYLLRFSIGPLPSTGLEGMVLILAVFWLFKGNLRQRLSALIKTPFFWPGILLITGATLSMIWATDTKAALGIWKAYFIEPFIIYLLLVDTFKKREEWQKVFIVLGITTIIFFFLALVQRLTGWWSPTWEWTVAGSRRVTGLYTSPNALGLYIAPVTALYVAWIFFQEKTANNLRIFQIAVILAGIGALFLAVSRGAMIALLATFFILAFIRWSKKWTLVAAFSLLLFVFVTPIFRSSFVSFATFQLDSGQSRLALYEGSIELLRQHPIKGVGLASFADRYEEVRPDEFTEKLIYPHNFFLNFWSETGLVGLVAVIWILVIVTKIILRERSFTHSWIYLAPLIVILVHGMVDVPYFKNDLAVLTWIFLAGLVVSRGSSNTSPSPS